MKGTSEARQILEEFVLNSCTESFGISHQVPFIEFRKDNVGDVTLSFEAPICIIPDNDLKALNLPKEEYELLCFQKVNLQRVVKIELQDNNDLLLHFANGRVLLVEGAPADRSVVEPWQFSNGEGTKSEYYVFVVALHNGGAAIWDNRKKDEASS
jgi:hypothetical protein